MHRIHVVGLNPRTGTTLLAECMRLCFQIERAEEHEAPLRKLSVCGGVYLTKNPKDIEHVSLRLHLDPRFNVICMARDPRDVVVSKHGARPDEYWHHTSLMRFRQRWATAKQLLGHSRFMLIRFEDLIAGPDEVQAAIAAKFPFLVETAKFSSFHQRGAISDHSEKALNGVRPIDASNKAKWPAHLDRLAEQLRKSGSISAELLELGYEVSYDWTSSYGLPALPERNLVYSRSRLTRRLANAAAALASGAMARLGVPIG